MKAINGTETFGSHADISRSRGRCIENRHANRRWLGSPLAQVLCLVALVAAVLAGMAADLTAGEIRSRRKSINPQMLNAASGYPGAAIDGWPLPGPRPYWGQALGATYYNWGYFGARHNHSQFISHSGYYGEYSQIGYSRGY